MTACRIVPGWEDLAVLEVLRSMRPEDVAEVFALRPDSDVFAVYAEMRLTLPATVARAVVWAHDRARLSRPVAVLRVVERSPGVGDAALVATPGFTLPMAREVADWVRREVVPTLAGQGFRRVECRSARSHRWAHRFLRRCGARHEARLRLLGRDGEDFEQFVWLADEMEREAGA